MRYDYLEDIRNRLSTPNPSEVMPTLVETRRPAYRILALDVDGTLLDSSGALRPSTVEAVARAAEAGIRPVLCTGRRYRRAWPIAHQLTIDAPLVCNSGALVKDPADHRTLWRADLEGPLLRSLLDLFEAHDEPAISFTDRDPSGLDFLVRTCPTGREHYDEYVDLNREHAEIAPLWMTQTDETGHFHLCAVGDRASMLRFESAVLASHPGQVRTFVQKSPRYSGWMCEILHMSASKWSAALHLAALWGIDASEIVAVGDDQNDVPMIEGAGLGVAMGHAPPEVQAVADLIIGDHHGDSLAAFVEEYLV